jgi:inorganic pyrophosphatase
MIPWHDVDKERIKPEKFLAFIEISKGSKNKYELDKKTGLLRLDRVLSTSMIYPENYGFIPRTFADDYDPLDVLVLCSEAIVPMSLVECFPIGVLIMTDNGLNDEKIIAVAKNDPFYNGYNDISEIPAHIMDEIKHFFQVYKSLEGKDTSVEVFKDRKAAEQIIQDCLDKYRHDIEPRIVAERKARGY